MTRKSQLERRALNDRDVLQPPTEDLVQLITFTSQHKVPTFDNDFYLKVSITVIGILMVPITHNVLMGSLESSH